MATKLEIYQNALRLLGEIRIAALTDDVEARYALDDAYADAVEEALTDGWWRFCFRSVVFTATAGVVGGLALPPGYSHQFARPAGPTPPAIFRIHSLGVIHPLRGFIQTDWYDYGANIACKYATVTLRYSEKVTAEASWPDVFANYAAAVLAATVSLRVTGAVPATVAAERQRRLVVAIASEAHEPPINLPEHAVKAKILEVLEEGSWRFSLDHANIAQNGTPSQLIKPYKYEFDKPAGWVRTVTIQRSMGTPTSTYVANIPHVDRESKWYADYAPIFVTYVSTSALDPTTWPELFARAIDAGLRVEEARNPLGPKSEQEIAARLAMYRATMKEAHIKGALNEQPRVYREGSWNRSRRIYGTGRAREQAYGSWWP